jgi:hypothetical protein
MDMLGHENIEHAEPILARSGAASDGIGGDTKADELASKSGRRTVWQTELANLEIKRCYH